MNRLVLLGGPTGVGKSTVLRLLAGRLPKSGVLDADDVWRVSDDLATAQRRPNAIGNVVAVMRGYFDAGCEVGILGWVFARAELYQPVIDALEDVVVEVQMLYLVADIEALNRRLAARDDVHLLDYAVGRRAMIEVLPFHRIDTTHLAPGQVADEVCAAIARRTTV
ncbi:MAG: AAA family ATPase [Pseudomonadales bacterium]